MKMNINLFFLIIILIVITFTNQNICQDYENFEISNNQIDSIAKAIFITQINYDFLKKEHEDYQDKFDIVNKQNLFEKFTMLLQNEQLFNDLNLILLKQNLKQDLFVFETYYPWVVFPPVEYYSLAITKKGKIYLLNNFWIDEFEDMIKEEFLDSLNKEKAYKIMELYFNAKFMYRFKIIDEENINKFVKKYKNIKSPLVTDSNKFFSFKFYSIDESNYIGEEERIMECNFTLTKQGDVKFTSYIMDNIR